MAKVLAFIRYVVGITFPLRFWGSMHNFNVICRGKRGQYLRLGQFATYLLIALKYFVTRRKYEKLSTKEILHQFKVWVKGLLK